ncbi:hypothetical protein [Aestuariispira ectoiniformans]|uniref:hypothetical protein n=1 Tax=Aestuariispira ectoiniformans TaxID=2775080 RepID=UPI00223B1B73|nr:hypothetical protein [Aestuariispira ectoiniformans]
MTAFDATCATLPQKDTTACFTVTAAAHPGMLPRVLEPFAKRGLVPSKLHAVEQDDGQSALLIDLQVAQMELETAQKIGNTLNQVFGVNSVLVSAKVAY